MIESMNVDVLINVLEFCNERLDLVRNSRDLYERELNLEVSYN